MQSATGLFRTMGHVSPELQPTATWPYRIPIAIDALPGTSLMLQAALVLKLQLLTASTDTSTLIQSPDARRAPLDHLPQTSLPALLSRSIKTACGRAPTTVKGARMDISLTLKRVLA